MKTTEIVHKINTAADSAIAEHLNRCKQQFVPSLDKTVSIPDYAGKLANLAVTFEAWSGDELVGLVAAYFNDTDNQSGFITNVSVMQSFTGRGIAGDLMLHCIRYAKEKKYREIVLEVNRHNTPAIKLYKKYGFTDTSFKDELKIMTLTLHD